MVGEDAELVALGFGQVGGVRFFEEQEEVEDVILGKVEVDDPCSSIFPSSRKCHACFAKPPATDEEVALTWISKQFILEGPEVLVIHTFGKLAGKKRSFDESQRHEKRDTLYSIEVKQLADQA